MVSLETVSYTASTTIAPLMTKSFGVLTRVLDPGIEDEDHVIRTCSYYEDLRASLNESMKGYLEEDLKTLFTKEEHIRGTAKLLVRINGRRFPKKNIEID